MVCDGFTGNIILKLAESLFEITQRKEIQHEYFDRFNFENYGGTPVLGISKPVIIGHGISKTRSFKNMILVAQKMIEKDIMKKLQTELLS
jgi:glycerol-3-phosphate acyltransferase PlsX